MVVAAVILLLFYCYCSCCLVVFVIFVILLLSSYRLGFGGGSPEELSSLIEFQRNFRRLDCISKVQQQNSLKKLHTKKKERGP